MKERIERVCAHYESPLGTMLLAATDRGLAGAWFIGQKHGPDASGWREDPSHPVLRAAKQQLHDYFAGRRDAFDLPLDLQAGTAFQQSVWQALCAIAPGATTTYGELGRRIGRPEAARAIGAAVGRNPISIVVPCHRVVGSDGALTGYAGGIDRKTALLALEAKVSGFASGLTPTYSLPVGRGDAGTPTPQAVDGDDAGTPTSQAVGRGDAGTPTRQ